MDLQDLATNDFIFKSNDHESGQMICRHCENEITVRIKNMTVLIFSSTKIKVFGNWCNCTSLEENIQQLLADSFGIEENPQTL